MWREEHLRLAERDRARRQNWSSSNAAAICGAMTPCRRASPAHDYAATPSTLTSPVWYARNARSPSASR